jgi:uncharacterized membrane protein
MVEYYHIYVGVSMKITYHNYKLRVSVVLILAMILVSLLFFISNTEPKNIGYMSDDVQEFLPTSISRGRSPSAGVNTEVQNSGYRSEAKGSTVLFVLNVTNTGSDNDTIEILNQSTKIWSITLFNMDNWALLTDTDGDNITDVGNVTQLGGVRYVGINITIPLNAANGETNIVTITASSSQNASVTSVTSLTIFALDPAVYASVGIESNQSQTAVPSSFIKYNLTVMNKGNFTDLIDLTKTVPSGWSATLYDEYSVPLSDDYNSNSLLDVNLPQNATKKIIVNVSIPSDVRYNYSNQITITATSSLNSSRSATAILSTYLYTTADIVLLGNATLYGKGGDSITYNITITNNGPANDTMELRNYSLFSGWNISLSYTNGTKLRDSNGDGGIDTDVVSVGNSLVVTANITIPINAYGNTTNNITITAISSNNGTERESTNLLVTISPFYGLEVSGNQSKNCGVGENATYTITVANKGSMNDVFDIGITFLNVSCALYKDNITLLTDTDGSSIVDTGILAPNEQVNISVRVSVPKTTSLINKTEYLDFNITSRGDSTKYLLRRLQVDMIKPAYVIVSPSSIQKSGDPGTSISQTFTIENNGFTTENLIIHIAPTLYRASTPIAGSWNMSVVAYGDLNLEGGIDGVYYANNTIADKEYTIRLNVAIPLGTSADIKNIVSIMVNSTNESATAQFIVAVNTVAMVNTSITNTTSLAGFNTTVEYMITVSNIGSVNDTIDCLNSSSNNWLVNVVNNTNGNLLVDTNSNGIVDVGNLTPGTSVNVLIRVNIPRTAVGGAIENTRVTFRSSFNSSVQSFVDLVTTIQTVYSISATPLNYTVEMEVNSTKTFDFALTNTGNMDDKYIVQISNLSMYWNFTVSGATLPVTTPIIAFNNTSSVSGELYVPRNASRTTHIIIVRFVSSGNNPNTFYEVPLIISVVKPKTRLIVTIDNTTKYGDVGTDVSYKAIFTNNDLSDSCKIELSSLPIAEELFVYNQTKIGTSSWTIIYTDEGGTILEYGMYGGKFVGTLNDMQSKTAHINIAIPSDATSDIMVRTNITATLYGEYGSSYQTSFTLFTKINPKISVDIYAGQTTNSGKPNTTVNSTIIVVNNGTSSDVLNVNISSNWTAKLFFLGTLLNDTNNDNITDIGNLSYMSSAELKLSVDIPPDVNYDTNDTITITVISSWNSTKRNNITITARASAFAEHIINASKYNDTNNPNTTVSYNITILNKGNAADSVKLYYTSSLGWDVRVLKDNVNLTKNTDGTVNVGVLTRNESGNITVEVAIPSNAAGDAKNVVDISINSTLVPTYTTNILLNTTANAIVDFDIGPNITQKAYPTKTFNCTVRVTNLGNVPDTIDINYTTSEGWQVSAYKINIQLSDSNNNGIIDTGVIGRGETVDITFRVVVPPDAQSNKTIDIVGTSSKNSSVYKSAQIFIEVDTSMKIELSTTNTKVYGNINRSNEFAISILNQADYSNIIDIQNSSLKEGWNISYYLNETPLIDTNDNGIIDVGTLSGYKNISIRVKIFIPPEPLAKLYEDYGITITASTASRSSTINITITPITYTLGLTPSENVSKNGDPGSTLSYNFTLRNSGNSSDTVKVFASSSRQWTIVVRDASNNPITNNISVPANSEIPLTAKISIPESEMFDITDNTTITVNSEKNGSNYDTVRFTSRVNKLINVVVSIDQDQSVMKWSWSVTTKQQICVLTIKNTGNAVDTIYVTNTTLPWSKISYYLSGLELSDYNSTLGYNVGAIERNSTKTLNVYLEEPPLQSSAMEYYDVTFTVFSSSDISRKGTSKLKINTGYAAITLNATSSTAVISPNDVAKFTLRVTNDGNTKDYITISIATGKNWVVDIYPPYHMLGNKYILQPKSYIDLTIYLTPPQVAMLVDSASVTATSYYNTSISSVIYLNTTVNPNVGLKPLLDKIPPVPAGSNITIVDDKGNSMNKIFVNEAFTIKIPIDVTIGVDFSKLRTTIKVGNEPPIRNDEPLSASEILNKSIIFTYKFKSVGVYNIMFSINSGSAESSAIDNNISLKIEVSKVDSLMPNWILFLPIFAAAITLVLGTALVVRAQRIKKRKEKEAKEKTAREREEAIRRCMMEDARKTTAVEKTRIVKKKKSVTERKKILEESGKMIDLTSKEKGVFIPGDKMSLSVDFSTGMGEKKKEVDERKKAIDLGEFAAPEKKTMKEEDELKMVTDFEIESKKPVKKIKEKKEEEGGKEEEEKEKEKKRKKKPPKAVIVEDGYEVEWSGMDEYK